MKQAVLIKIHKGDQLIDSKEFNVDQIIIGQTAEAQIRLEDPEISAIHSIIELRDSGFYVCDLGSVAGTFKNDVQILDEPLSSGDEIRVGPYKLSFFVVAPKPKVPPQPVTQAPTVAPPVRSLKTASEPKRPQIVPTKPVNRAVEFGNKKNKTFAPPSEIKDLKDIIQPTKGNIVEVTVAWKERVIGIYHFTTAGEVKMGGGPKNQIVLPQAIATESYKLMTLQNGATIHAYPDMDVEAYSQTYTQSFEEMQARNRMTRTANRFDVRLEQGEVIKLSWLQGRVVLYIRYVPDTSKAILAPLFDLTASELTGIVITFLVVGFIALYSTIYAPEPTPVEEEKEHTAVFVYKAKPTPPPVEKVKPPSPEPTPPPVAQATPAPTPKPTPVKIQVTETKSDKEKPKATAQTTPKDVAKPTKTAAASSASSDLQPKPNKINRPKSFTSTKQGGAVQTGKTEGANAQSSNKDVSKVGLFAAFSGGGVRKELDKAYSGSGEVLGMGEKATGTSGQADNRAGDDIGSKFKDTGAGGKGTATQGIAGLKTKGRGAGTSGYGSAVGLGDKGNVSVEVGETEAGFSGTIDREAVRRVVREHLREIRACYEKALNQTPGLEGKIVIEWQIGEQGIVKVASKKSSTMNNAEVENCMAARIKSWRFPEPPPGTLAVVSYPFSFVSQK